LLLRLRKPGETGYKIPKSGLFRWVSCPNHFGEIVEWSGFALICWNLPALSFAIWTAANLIPRAVSHHNWYREKFEDYPLRRKAVLPFLY
jgi:steroid 5-alpha reductase family enzyme